MGLHSFRSRQEILRWLAAAVLVVCWVGQRYVSAASINEIRTNQIGDQTDEYFEIHGSPGESLDSMTYLVIGDSLGGGSGVIETVISLENQNIPDDGYFLAAELTFGAPGTAFEGVEPDIFGSFIFEDRQNRTHVLVSGFFGALFDDLDPDDSGSLSVQPWGTVVDAVAFVEDPDTSQPGVDQLYATQLGGSNVGPTSTGVAPAHIYRLPDGSGGWVIGDVSLDPNVDDTPGAMNGTVAPDFDCEFVDDLVAEIVAGTNGASFDLDGNGVVDTNDLTRWRTDAGAVLTLSGNPIQEGDANLDGTVDGLDFIEWNSHKFTSMPAWCSGDFNADGIIDGLDFILWNGNKFTSADAVGVPEPGSAALALGMLLCCAQLMRRHSQHA